MWLFLIFLAVPLIEIGLFIEIGGAIGLWPTLAIVVITAVLGTSLVRSQGSIALSQIKSRFHELSDPTEALAHGAMILIAGALLLTPGFFTDGVGFALLVPPLREFLIGQLRARVHVTGFSTTTADPEKGVIIDEDGEVIAARDPGPSKWTRH
ncbi:FxsA family protein [Rhodobacteraceae bacterium XHP0102]|nr:FxsA family protein [Rhodobacteraceae bacterium XHP0102]